MVYESGHLPSTEVKMTSNELSPFLDSNITLQATPT